MTRKLKTYQTSLGFFDLAIAAPSMKAALETWGADSNLFHQGAAKESDDPDVVAATVAKPGVVLRRPSDPAAPSASTWPRSRLSRGDRKPKKPAGIKRRRDWKLRCGARVTRSQRQKRPSVRSHSESHIVELMTATSRKYRRQEGNTSIFVSSSI
jgi:colicin import membrane protein